MMPGARCKIMRPNRARHTAGRTDHDRCALVIRFKRIHLGTRTGRSRLPFGLERGLVARGVEGGEELLIAFDRLLDEVACGGGEHRASLLLIGIKQVTACPALQCRRQLPAEIGGIF